MAGRQGRGACRGALLDMLTLKNLVRRRTRTALTVLGVAIGVSIVFALTAISRGFRTQVNGMFAAGAAHLVVSRKDAADPILSYLPSTLLDELRARADVEAAEPMIIGATQAPPLAIFVFFGTTRTSPFLGDVRVVEGESLFGDTTDGTGRVSLGRLAARNLKKEVGDAVVIAGEELTVVGVHESATPLIDAAALLPYAEAQRLAGLEGKMTTALVTVTDFSREGLAATEAAIEAAHPMLEATPPARWADAFDEFDLADQAATVFTFLAICIGGLSVMNTMLMSVFERTREIGVLQAVGWSRGMVVRQVLIEGFLIACAGAPLGILLGVGVVEGIARIEQFSWVAGDYGPSVFVMGTVVAFGMCAVGAAYPAWRASGVAPVEALRYE